MSTITKKQAKDLRNAFECWQQDYDPAEDKEQYDMFGLGMVAMDTLLASLEAEAVAFVMADDLKDGSIISTPAYRDLGEAMERTVGDVVALYAAPPAPVSLPTFEKWCELTEQKPVGWVRDAMKEAYDGCRAAMLKEAEPVTTAYKLRDAVEIIRNSGIAIDAEKIFAERDALNAPDCWCRTCRPVTISDMRFVVCPECGNKRCPHANDHRNACTGSNEPGQEGSAYPAAPQQEVKP